MPPRRWEEPPLFGWEQSFLVQEVGKKILFLSPLGEIIAIFLPMQDFVVESLPYYSRELHKFDAEAIYKQ